MAAANGTQTTAGATAPALPTGRVAEIVAAARALIDEGGPDALTMRAVADRLGIRAPSLYKHIPDKADLESLVIAAAFTEQAEAFTKATRRARDPLAALVRAYRTWALAHPHLYRLMTNRPLDRDRLPAGVEASTAAPLIAACGGDPDRARAAWAFAHGMTSLELAARFPAGADLDAAWQAGIDAFRPPPPLDTTRRAAVRPEPKASRRVPADPKPKPSPKRTATRSTP